MANLIIRLLTSSCTNPADIGGAVPFIEYPILETKQQPLVHSDSVERTINTKITKNKHHLFVSTNAGIYRYDYSFFNGIKKPISSAKSNFLLYPNPSNGMVYWNGNIRLANAELFTISGVKLNVKIDLQNNAIHLNGINPGTYILQGNTVSGETVNAILIKEE